MTTEETLHTNAEAKNGMDTSERSEHLQVIVAAFNNEDAADLALDELQMAGTDHGFAIQTAAIIRRDAKGAIHTNEINTWDERVSARTSSIIGGVIGLVGGLSGVVAGSVGGAVAGTAAVRVHNTKTPVITRDVLKPLEDVVRPNCSALVAVIGNQSAGKMRDLLEKAGAVNLRQTELAAEIADAFANHTDVVYAVAVLQGGLDAVRITVSDTSAEYTGVVATEHGICVEGGQVAVIDDSQGH